MGRLWTLLFIACLLLTGNLNMFTKMSELRLYRLSGSLISLVLSTLVFGPSTFC